MRRKRAFTLPDVGINETIFNGLEQYFTALEGNELSSGTYVCVMNPPLNELHFQVIPKA